MRWRWILGAGSVAVVAHPAATSLDGRVCGVSGHFRDLGGQAIEVVSGSHSLDDVGTYRPPRPRIRLHCIARFRFSRAAESYVDLGMSATLRTAEAGLERLLTTGNDCLPQIHPDDPSAPFVRAAEIVREGGVIAFPTDSCYALGCHLGDKGRGRPHPGDPRGRRAHHLTLMCRDLSKSRGMPASITPSIGCSRRRRRAVIPSSLEGTRSCRGACCTRSARRSACAFRNHGGAGAAGPNSASRC